MVIYCSAARTIQFCFIGVGFYRCARMLVPTFLFATIRNAFFIAWPFYLRISIINSIARASYSLEFPDSANITSSPVFSPHLQLMLRHGFQIVLFNIFVFVILFSYCSYFSVGLPTFFACIVFTSFLSTMCSRLPWRILIGIAPSLPTR